MLRAGDIYAGDHYGSNLWDLQSNSAESYFKSWNTFVKLVYNVPRSTHTYLVENFLAKKFVPTRNQVLSGYVTFLHSLINSPNWEVRILARIIRQNHQSVTRTNADYITECSGLSPWDYGKIRIQAELPRCEVTETNLWRVSLLTELFDEQKNRTTAVEDTASIQAWIDAVCST